MYLQILLASGFNFFLSNSPLSPMKGAVRYLVLVMGVLQGVLFTLIQHLGTCAYACVLNTECGTW